DGAAEKTQAGLLFLGIVFVGIDGIGIGGEGFVDPFFGGGGVADLDEALGLCDVLRIGGGGGEQFLEDGVGGGGGDGAVVGELRQTGVSLGGDTEGREQDAPFVGGFGGDSEEKIGEAARRGAGGDRGFEQLGIGAFIDQRHGLLGREA